MIRRWHEERAKDERGFVMVWTAISLTVLMAMAGFAVDIGAWYSRAGRIQRAADAAALAGVVYMPSNLPRARAVALETAARNGFTDPSPNQAGDEIDITVEPVTGVQQRLKVTITDHEVEAFFSAVFIDDIEIGRQAIGHFAEPIPLGSPENQFGIGPAQPLTPSAYGIPDTGFYPPRQNFYAAVNGRCAAAEEGDLLLSSYDGNAPTSTGSLYTCAAELHREYDPQGYTYVIEYDPATAALPYAWQVQVLDPAFTPSTTDPSTNGSQDYPLDYTWTLSGLQWTRNVNTTDLDTTYTFVAPDTAGTPLDQSDDQVLATQTYVSKQAGTNGQWVSIPGAVIPVGGHASSAAVKKYRLRVRTDSSRPNSWGVNVFAIRLVPTIPGFGVLDVRCTTVNTAAGCPTIYAENYMSIWVNASASTAELYLAQIASIHAGKRLRIDLWDPGEGSRALKILAPTGTGTWGPTSFTWRTEPCPGSPCGSPYAGTANSGNSYELRLGNPCLVPGEPSYTSYSQPGSRAGRCLFNDRHVIIELDIPLNYAANNGGWWRIQYLTHGGGARVTDRTTWQIRVEGDPVHLVDE